MNKKLMAVAIAGAFGVPVLAYAQASNVQVYGLLNYGVEQRNAGGGDTSLAPASNVSSVRPAASFTATPANISTRTATPGSGSNFGLRGREDLGGGFYAGFQIEISLQGDAVAQVSSSGNGTNATYRNTGVWLGTSVGEFGTGMWDTPYTLNTAFVGAHGAYTNSSSSSTAALTGGLAFAQATYSGQPLLQLCNTAAANGFVPAFTSCFTAATSFNRRQPNSFWWQSPDWSGFKIRAQYGTSNGDATTDLAPAATPNNAIKATLFSAAGTYSNGPVYVGLGYEKHYDMSAFGLRNSGAGATVAIGGAGTTTAQFATGAMTGSNDWGWNLNGRYTFGGGFSAGLFYERLSYSWSYDGTAAGTAAANITGMSRNAWRLDGAYQTGPHTVGLTYTKSQDISGTLIGNSFNGADTNVSSWVLGYAYSFSKRTAVTAYYNNVTNATNARTSGTTFNGLSPASGGDPKYYGVGLKHSF